MRRTIVASLVLGGIIVAGAAYMAYVRPTNSDTTVWSDPAYQRRECDAAAAIAAKFDGMIRAERIKQSLDPHNATAYVSDLAGVAGARIMTGDPDAWWNRDKVAVRRLMQSRAGPLKCLNQFRAAHVRTLPLQATNGETYNIAFSRLWLTDGGRRAEFFSSRLCGNLCGGTFSEVWVKRVDGWHRLIDKRISVF
jgi:hypothetical protein